MEKSVKKMYKAAKSDYTFKEKLKEVDTNYSEPTMFSPTMEKIAWAAIYFGYLIGKGKYIESEWC